MKKFLVVLVAIIVVVCLGLTTYYFLRNDEVINFSTRVIYCNVGDVITVEDLGYTIKKPSNSTTIDYNAGGEEVTQYINFDTDRNHYVALQGGEVTLLITTTNERCPEFRIDVHIGDGSEENPYYIDNQADLEKIGVSYALDASYVLTSDITLTNSFVPIGRNATSSLWVGFGGNFDGQGHTIYGLNLQGTDYSNAGLFYSLNNGAKVSNINISGAVISGGYNYAGALAGVANGEISRVRVSNANITNTGNNGVTGGIVGSLTGSNSTITISYVEDTTITIGSSESTTSIQATVGGFIGDMNLAKAQATYADANIVMLNATGNAGGYVGRMVVNNNYGTIQESYSISTSTYADLGALVGTFETDSSFILGNVNPLTYFIGNYVVADGHDVINSYNTKIFDQIGNSFYNENNSLYLIRSFGNVNDMVDYDVEYVFYAISQTNRVMWDSSAWSIVAGQLPRLIMTDANLSGVSSEYFTKDLDEETIGNENDTPIENRTAFLDYIEQCRQEAGAIENKKYVLAGDIDLTGITWEPIALTNSVFDGNGHTISGLSLTTGTNSNLGLFSIIDNSTVRDLTITDVTINGNVTLVGGLAGSITSSSTNSVSTITNVDIVYADADVSGTITNLGGIAGVIENGTIINSSTVSNLTTGAASILNVGGLVARINSGTLEDNGVTGIQISATRSVGGLAAVNDGTIRNNGTNNTVEVVINYNATGYAATVGGIAGSNTGTIYGNVANIDINIDATDRAICVGGVAGTNSGTISNTTITGTGIEIADVDTNTMYVGGVTAQNNATITNTNVLVDTVGTYIAGKEFSVGGVTATNSNANSTISQVIMSADVYGNNVSGIVVHMNNADATVDQVLVAKYNAETQEISENMISGDRYVAGISYEFSAGTISNVQAKSQIRGMSNDTRSSLIVLIFPNEATLVNSTIDSSLNGYGTFYKETWKDYTQVGTDNFYNLYGIDSAAGRMQSVVINTDAASRYGVNYITAEFAMSPFGPSYENTEESSYFRDVTEREFRQASTFRGSFTYRCNGFLWTAREYTRELTFDFVNGTWVDSNGIALAFVSNVQL